MTGLPAAEIRATPARGAFLEVNCSLTGRYWQARLEDERLAYAIAQTHDLPEPLARVLAGRGVHLEAVPRFLAPSLRETLVDPSRFADMDRAAERLAASVVQGERVCIFGDYDVDGATASALLKRYLDALGAKTLIYIPDRQAEGYGPNAPALERLAQQGVRLVVTVDCGTGAHAALAAARRLGLDVIVVDHHQVSGELPPAFALVNPSRLDCASGQGALAAVGVAFMLAVATNRALRQEVWLTRTGRSAPDLLRLLDLVALGTVCDVVPLTGLNRAFVSQGLKVMARGGNIGLGALARAAGLECPPDCYHLGFVLGPRVNAGGRVGQADLGARLLTTDDPGEAQALAERLDRLNRERQAIEAQVLEEAVGRVEAEGTPSDFAPIVVAREGWHSGVIGIVASRLKETYRRPAVVIALEGGVGKGSGRSIYGVDLGRAIGLAVDRGLLLSGGGHAMAAGLTVDSSKVDDFRAFLAARLGADIKLAAAQPRLLLDGALHASALRDTTLAQVLARAEPYGPGNPEALFAIPNAGVTFADVVGSEHVATTLETDGARLRAIAFRAAAAPLGKALLAARGEKLHVAGRIKEARRGGLELHVEDAALSTG
jgi:single-stranded-DNA-specific exonuclease